MPGRQLGDPVVSVVVPTYNRSGLVTQTLDSVAAQSFAAWECIVVDDGSTDDTAEVVAAYVERDARFRYVWQENSSASRARNRGLGLARGEYVLFLDSDDLLAADALAWKVEVLRSRPEVVLVYGQTMRFTSDDPTGGFLYKGGRADLPSGEAFEALLSNNSMYSPLIRTAAIREEGGFDTSFGSAEDWDMWLTLARRGRIHYEPRLAIHSRIHAGNKSANVLWNYRSARRVARKHLERVPAGRRRRVARETRRFFARGYTHKLLGQAIAEAERGDWKRAAEAVAEAARLAPARLLRVSSIRRVWRVVRGRLRARTRRGGAPASGRQAEGSPKHG